MDYFVRSYAAVTIMGRVVKQCYYDTATGRLCQLRLAYAIQHNGVAVDKYVSVLVFAPLIELLQTVQSGDYLLVVGRPEEKRDDQLAKYPVVTIIATHLVRT